MTKNKQQRTNNRNEWAAYMRLFHKNNPGYRMWQNMMTRCYNPNTPSFNNYGGGGITVHPAWHDSKVFLAYVAKHLGPKPTPQHSFDRWPDPNGNYVPGNVQWSTKREQCLHQRKRKGTSSQYLGVHLHCGRWWYACISLPGDPRHYLGSFTTELAAALARDAAVIKYKTGAILNFAPKKKPSASVRTAKRKVLINAS